MDVYYVNENMPNNCAMIHHTTANNQGEIDIAHWTRQARIDALISGIGRALGPYYSVKDAIEAAFYTGKPISICGHCFKGYKFDKI
ncbi:MAG: hypothetical protein SFH39_03860 [Candidatus Magnetobacterium sp. LHC-1]|uniref:Uncharacterized protein n=1 Tax=Candidatus Magnetobacterium casense TaxID=1455061 RepID=A0ABS6RXR9_9BACT|nr:hypothetical protein [Candidatus Magnetobacterium casensis]MBF0608348.1 hypothetical protein [Nitrospirota bacterium]MBV6341432.1 hypothetical protein [Candidatus Magnetobacterium casensis]